MCPSLLTSFSAPFCYNVSVVIIIDDIINGLLLFYLIDTSLLRFSSPELLKLLQCAARLFRACDISSGPATFFHCRAVYLANRIF